MAQTFDWTAIDAITRELFNRNVSDLSRWAEIDSAIYDLKTEVEKKGYVSCSMV